MSTKINKLAGSLLAAASIAGIAQAVIVTEIELDYTTIYADSIDTTTVYATPTSAAPLSIISSSDIPAPSSILSADLVGSSGQPTDADGGLQITVDALTSTTSQQGEESASVTVTTVTWTSAVTTSSAETSSPDTTTSTENYTPEYTAAAETTTTLSSSSSSSSSSEYTPVYTPETTSQTEAASTASPFEYFVTSTLEPSSSSSSSSSATTSLEAVYNNVVDVSTTNSPTSTTSSSQDPTTSSTQAPSTTVETSTTSSSASSSSSTTDDFSSQVLAQHNQKRSLHKSTSDLSWSSDLASTAQSYADSYDCSGTLVHSHGDYGQNLALGYSLYDGTTAVDGWYDEISQYDFSNPGFSSSTGHFTQVVWKGTTQVGCGYKNCNNEWGTYLVCNYQSAGNVLGQFSENVMALN
ncbi:hypothetical protein ACO0RG_004480 [Hanseniaspora osmophila]